MEAKVPVRFDMEAMQQNDVFKEIRRSTDTELILDFSDCVYVDSLSLGTMIQYSTKFKRVIARNIKPHIKAMFDVIKLDRIIEIQE